MHLVALSFFPRLMPPLACRASRSRPSFQLAPSPGTCRQPVLLLLHLRPQMHRPLQQRPQLQQLQRDRLQLLLPMVRHHLQHRQRRDLLWCVGSTLGRRLSPPPPPQSPPRLRTAHATPELIRHARNAPPPLKVISTAPSASLTRTAVPPASIPPPTHSMWVWGGTRAPAQHGQHAQPPAAPSAGSPTSPLPSHPPPHAGQMRLRLPPQQWQLQRLERGRLRH